MRGELARNYKDRVVYKSRKTAILPAFFELTLSIMRRSKADTAKTRQTILDANHASLLYAVFRTEPNEANA